jgi:hypothetical protein
MDDVIVLAKKPLEAMRSKGFFLLAIVHKLD